MSRVRRLPAALAGPFAVVLGALLASTACAPPSMDPTVSVDPIERLGRKAVHPDAPASVARIRRSPAPGASDSAGRDAGQHEEPAAGRDAQPRAPGARPASAGDGPEAPKGLPETARAQPGSGAGASGARRAPRRARHKAPAPRVRTRPAPAPAPTPRTPGLHPPAFTESTTRLLTRLHRFRTPAPAPSHPKAPPRTRVDTENRNGDTGPSARRGGA
ncbi:hypothetical protein ACWEFL_12725 [Streptomyces sp. NPDC004838]